MGADEIPTFGSMFGPRSRGRKPLPATQFSLLLEPESPSAPRYAPLVPAPEPAADPEPPTPPQPVLYTVRALLSDLRQRLEAAFPTTVHVEGEISNFRAAASGHLYFTLRDGDAQLSVVMFRMQARFLAWKPRDGLHVELRGRVAVYESRGQLQLIADQMRPRGEGALQLAFEELKRRLAAEALFDSARKRPLPAFPHCIGVVTSIGGAALRDILSVVQRRHARLNLLIYPAVVQGSGCSVAVAAGIRWFNRNPGRVDLILITRGGGSLEDLAGFNDETLARTIAASALPVVSAVGHEIDTSIADLVADLRAPTPSAAAELITAAQHRIGDRVLQLERRVHRAGQFHILHARQRLARLSAAWVLRRVQDAIRQRAQRIDELRFRLQAALRAQALRQTRARSSRLTALQSRLERQNPTLRLATSRRRLQFTETRLTRLRTDLIATRLQRVLRAESHLQALSPLAVLSRGYAIVFTEQGTILRNAGETQPNQLIEARLAQGTVRARVTEA